MALMSADRNAAIALERDQTPRAGFPARWRFPQWVPGWNVYALDPDFFIVRSIGCSVPRIIIACPLAGLAAGTRLSAAAAPHIPVKRLGVAPEGLCREGQFRPVAISRPNRLCRAHRLAIMWCGFQVVRRRSIRAGALAVNARHSQRFR